MSRAGGATTGRVVGRALVGSLAAVALVALIAAASELPYPAAHGQDAWIRLSWRSASASATRECEPDDDEVRERVPVHMRGPGACRRPPITFRLRVVIDGQELLDEHIHAGGSHGDRPVFVYRELRVEPGCRRVSVSFAREEDEEEEEREIRVVASLALSAREVALITLDRRSGAPVVHGRPCAGAR